MKISKNISLKSLTTMKLGGTANTLIEVNSVDEILKALDYSKEQNLPFFIIGGGSNLIGLDKGFDGVLIKMTSQKITLLSDETSYSIIKFDAGTLWDDAVQYSVEKDLSGIECLSAIPGTVGATPVQNIGAYGQEIKDTLIETNVIDTYTRQMLTLSNKDCYFAYRDSIFKKYLGKYIILDITLKLNKFHLNPPFYVSLNKYLEENQVNEYSPKNLRKAVIEIRKNKLPDPKILPNSGSFFKNAIIENDQFQELLKLYPNMPYYKLESNLVKIPSGWLIEQSGFKGKSINGIKINKENALVLINENAKSSIDLFNTRNQIIEKVFSTFKIKLEQEPLILQ